MVSGNLVEERRGLNTEAKELQKAENEETKAVAASRVGCNHAKTGYIHCTVGQYSLPRSENSYVTFFEVWDAIRSRALFSAAQQREAKASESVTECRASRNPCGLES